MTGVINPQKSKPTPSRLNKSNTSTPVNSKQGIPKEHERVAPSKRKPSEASPALKLNEQKREGTPNHPKRQDIKTGGRPEIRQPAVKQEKKQIKKEYPAPIGRPD